jgi:5-methyltetrahydropteroyltriglutamate--homocysteine methyltransferase
MAELRIPVTHAGSLPRPAALDELLVRRSRGEAVDPEVLAGGIDAAVAEVVRRQAEVGVDIANDGEAPRESFFTYVRWRMTGFDGASDRQVMRDRLVFPSFVELQRAAGPRPGVSLMRAPAATGAVSWIGDDDLAAELELLGRHTRDAGFADVFCTSTSPGMPVAAMSNRHYAGDDEYLAAVGAALAHEYRAIVDAGFLLQIDAPDLAMERHTSFADRSLDDFRAFVRAVVATQAAALAGIDPARVRLHVCWGNYEGPHHLDVALEEIVDLLAEAPVGGFLISMANPRHAHEVRLLDRLPASATVVVGAIDTTTNYVEHPQVVADRLVRAAEVLGDPSRVVAGTDCGFETSAGYVLVAEELAWLKLAALREGADLASHQLT